MSNRRVWIPLSLVLSAAGAQAAHAQALWKDVTSQTIGETAEWTSKLDLADLNGDGLVDILFANGPAYHKPGEPELTRIFLNQGTGKRFFEATDDIIGGEAGLTRVVKVRDVSGDGAPDILIAGSYQTQTRLLLGDGKGGFRDATDSNLPKIPTSAGDLEIGDVDGDGDLDLVFADWGASDPCTPTALACPPTSAVSPGGRQLLWRNTGDGHFEDATATSMPTTKVQWSWDAELVDVDNDLDLDYAISCKACEGSFLFINDGKGKFKDSSSQMPQFSNNYEFEPLDVNGDGFMDLVTINDGDQVSAGDVFDKREHVFLNDGKGGFKDATKDIWPASENVGADDNAIVVFDFDSDGDPDFLIGSLSGSDRLMINNDGKLKVQQRVLGGPDTQGTLGIAVADLNGDKKIDVVMSQGELADPEKVYFGDAGVKPDTAPPVIDLANRASLAGSTLTVRARIHDNKTPVMPHDFEGAPQLAVKIKGAAVASAPMQWYGGHLWRGQVEIPAGKKAESYQICAIDAAGNKTCTDPISASGGGGDSADCASGNCEQTEEPGGCSVGGVGANGMLAWLGALLALCAVSWRRARR